MRAVQIINVLSLIGSPMEIIQESQTHFSTQNFVDKSLINHVMQSTTVESISECMERCQEYRNTHRACYSFNTELNAKSNKRICELNDVTASQHPEDFIYKPGFVYYEQL